jgi:hypothetical protein
VSSQVRFRSELGAHGEVESCEADVGQVVWRLMKHIRLLFGVNFPLGVWNGVGG